MSDWMIWLGLVGMMAMTLITRCGLIVWPGPIHLPARLQRALRFAPMAAISAVIVPSVLFLPDGGMADWIHPRTLSAMACLLAWWASRQMAITLTAGMLAYAISKLIL